MINIEGIDRINAEIRARLFIKIGSATVQFLFTKYYKTLTFYGESESSLSKILEMVFSGKTEFVMFRVISAAKLNVQRQPCVAIGPNYSRRTSCSIFFAKGHTLKSRKVIIRKTHYITDGDPPTFVADSPVGWSMEPTENWFSTL